MAERRYTINAYTVNLLPPHTWNGRRNTADRKDGHNLMDLLAQEDVRATFFVEPSLAHSSPDLLKEIAAQGHETGLLVSAACSSDPARLRATVIEGKDALESLLQRRLFGCRILPLSPSGSRSLAEYAILAEAGFAYSSGAIPPRDWRLGLQNSKRRAWTVRLQEEMLWELPITTWRLFGLGIFSLPSSPPEQHPTWTIARSIEGMNRHGEPALLSQQCVAAPSASVLTADALTAERLKRIFRTYRFSTTFDAFASRLIRGFDDEARGMGRRTSIIRCDSRTAATIL